MNELQQSLVEEYPGRDGGASTGYESARKLIRARRRSAHHRLLRASKNRSRALQTPPIRAARSLKVVRSHPSSALLCYPHESRNAEDAARARVSEALSVEDSTAPGPFQRSSEGVGTKVTRGSRQEHSTGPCAIAEATQSDAFLKIYLCFISGGAQE